MVFRAEVPATAGLMVVLLAGCGGTTKTTTEDAGHTASSTTSGTSRSSGASSGSPGSSTTGHSAGSAYSGAPPQNHRPNDDQCTTPAPPGQCPLLRAVPDAGGDGGSRCQDAGGGGPGDCTMDCQCTSGIGGRCNVQPEGALICSCGYDSCADDSACPTGQTCACHGSAYVNGGNTCVSGDCRVDSDCGAGGYCSPSSSTGGCGTFIAGYYCHTGADQCVNDADCNGGGSGANICTYSTSKMHWVCGTIELCP